MVWGLSLELESTTGMSFVMIQCASGASSLFLVFSGAPSLRVVLGVSLVHVRDLAGFDPESSGRGWMPDGCSGV